MVSIPKTTIYIAQEVTTWLRRWGSSVARTPLSGQAVEGRIYYSPLQWSPDDLLCTVASSTRSCFTSMRNVLPSGLACCRHSAENGILVPSACTSRCAYASSTPTQSGELLYSKTETTLFSPLNHSDDYLTVVSDTELTSNDWSIELWPLWHQG
jgi:hypothetical protein